MRKRQAVKHVQAVLETTDVGRGAPKNLCNDNGHEFIGQSVRQWLAGAKVSTLYIEPGSPWANASSERLNSRMRDEFLNPEVFTSLAEAKVLAQDNRQQYNKTRPPSSLHLQTPSAYAARGEAIRIFFPRAEEGHDKKPKLNINPNSRSKWHKKRGQVRSGGV